MSTGGDPGGSGPGGPPRDPVRGQPVASPVMAPATSDDAPGPHSGGGSAPPPGGAADADPSRAEDEHGHLQCPYCAAYEVSRLYLATLRLDSCECRACGARWDEDPRTGEFRGRASRRSTVLPRD